MSKKIYIVILILVGLALIVFAAPAFLAKTSSVFPASGDWYAVHLTNGHVYFGHLKSLNSDTITLTDVRYLEPYDIQIQNSQSQSFQVQQTPQQVYNIVTRGAPGSTLPTDQTLFINRAVVLFWEKLSPDAEVVKGIERGIQ